MRAFARKTSLGGTGVAVAIATFLACAHCSNDTQTSDVAHETRNDPSSSGGSETSGSGGQGAIGTGGAPSGGKGATGTGGVVTVSEAGTSPNDAGIRAPIADTGAPRPDPCAVAPANPVTPDVGSGVVSGCPQKICDGFPAGADLTATYTANYPASAYAGCTTINGSAVLASSQNPDLAELACLERVKGDLLIWNNPGLTSLHGLESLTAVEGTFGIGVSSYLSSGNVALSNIDHLTHLESVGGSFDIALYAPLTSLDGPPALVLIGGALQIGISDISGDPTAQPTVDLTGFGSLREIAGDFSLGHVRTLRRITGFPVLEHIGGAFWVSGATELQTLSGFPKLGCIDGTFAVTSQYLEANTSLTSIGPFPSLTHIGGAVRVEGNENLGALHLFDTVQSVAGGTIRIADNPVLSDLSFAALDFVADDVTIAGQPLVSECVLGDLVSRLSAAGWTHRLTSDGVLACSGSCDGPRCVTAP